MAAVLTGVGAALRDPMEFAVRATAGAAELSPAVLLFHDAVETGRIIRVLGLELFEGVLAHLVIPCPLGIVCPITYLSSRDKRAVRIVKRKRPDAEFRR